VQSEGRISAAAALTTSGAMKSTCGSGRGAQADAQTGSGDLQIPYIKVTTWWLQAAGLSIETRARGAAAGAT